MFVIIARRGYDCCVFGYCSDPAKAEEYLTKNDYYKVCDRWADGEGTICDIQEVFPLEKEEK